MQKVPEPGKKVTFIDNSNKEHKVKSVELITPQDSIECLIEDLSSPEYDYLYSQPIYDYWEDNVAGKNEYRSGITDFLRCIISDLGVIYFCRDNQLNWLSFPTTGGEEQIGRLKW